MSKLRLNIEANNNGVTIQRRKDINGADADTSVITITATAGNVSAKNEDGTGAVAQTGAHPWNGVEEIKIVCPWEKAEKLYGAMIYKDAMKGTVTDAGSQAYKFLLRAIDDAVDATHIVQTDATHFIINDGSLDNDVKNIIEIGAVDDSGNDFKPHTGVRDNLTTQRNDLFSLLGTFFDIQKHYGSSFRTATTPSSTPITLRDETTNLTKLESYLINADDVDDAANDGDAGNYETTGTDAEKDKRTILNASHDGTAMVYRDEVKFWVKFLREMKIWKEIVGLNTVEEVLKANANGFTLWNRNNTVGTISNTAYPGCLNFNTQNTPTPNVTLATRVTVKDFFPSSRKYLGMPIFDESQTVGDDAGHDATHIFDKLSNGSNNCDKNNIERFRRTFHDQTKENKEDFRGFSPKDSLTATAPATSDKDATAANYKWGTHAGDVVDIMDKNPEIKGREDGKKIVPSSAEADSALTFKNDDLKFTKTVFDAKNIADTQRAINAFFNTDFDVAIGGKKNVLNMLFAAIQTPTFVTAYDYQNTASDDDKKKITDTYKRFKDFLGYLEVDYSTYDKSRKDELNKAHEELLEFRDAISGEHHVNNNGTWNKAIREKLAQINAAKDKDKPKQDDFNTKLTQFKTDNKDKKPWEKIANDAGINKDNFDKVKELVDLLKGWKNDKTTRTAANKTKIEAFKNAKEADKKSEYEAWKIVNGYDEEGNETTDDAKRVGDVVLKIPVEKNEDNSLQQAKDNARSVMGDDIYNIIVKDNNKLGTADLVKKATDIFTKAKEAWGKSVGDGTLRNELDKFKTDDKDAWDAVNKYQRDKDGKECKDGYAAGALKHLASFDKGRQAMVTDSGIDKVTDRTSYDKAVTKLKADSNYEKNKPDLEEFIIPLGKLLIAVNADSKAKELAGDIGKLINKLPKDYNDTEYESSLDTLKSQLNKLKKYGKDGNEKAFYNKLDTDDKAIFDKLVKSLESKVSAMEKKANEGKNSPSQETKTPFWKSGWGITLIIAAVVVVLAAVAYFIKTNSSEEGEGSDEE